MERMLAQAKELGPATATRFADVLSTGLNDMRGATSPRLLLEIMAARMLLPAVDDSYEALLQRVEQLERGVGSRIPPPLRYRSLLMLLGRVTAPPLRWPRGMPAIWPVTEESNLWASPPRRRIRPPPGVRAEAAHSAAEGAARARALMAERQAKKKAASQQGSTSADLQRSSGASPRRAPVTPEPANEPSEEAATASAAATSAPASAPASSTPEEQASPAAVAAADFTAEDFSSQWVAIRNAVRPASRTLDVMLATARVIDYQPDSAQLSISPHLWPTGQPHQRTTSPHYPHRGNRPNNGCAGACALPHRPGCRPRSRQLPRTPERGRDSGKSPVSSPRRRSLGAPARLPPPPQPQQPAPPPARRPSPHTSR
ncbi:MAG: hypothetical protein U1U88_000971 [Lawsonella clevelandensis]